MADKRSKPSAQGENRINVKHPHELRDWSRNLGVPPERVKEAVQAVGDRASRVREYLAKDKPAAPGRKE